MSDYKRDHPRIKQSLSAEIVTAGDKTFFVTTCDVSRRGVQLLCDATTVREIFGATAAPVPTRLSGVLLKLQLGHGGSDAERIEAQCKAVFSRRISEQQYRVGLQIETIAPPARLALDGFIDGSSGRTAG